MCYHAFLQGIFLIQEPNPCLLCLLHWQAGSFPLALPGKPLSAYTWLCYFPLVTLYFEKCFLSVKLFQTVSENSKYPLGSRMQVHTWLWAEPLGQACWGLCSDLKRCQVVRSLFRCCRVWTLPALGLGHGSCVPTLHRQKELVCYKFGVIFSPQDQWAED